MLHNIAVYYFNHCWFHFN